uniref:Zinc finger CCCH domain-containing protein 11A n=1 Tax=Callorhinchus milii TaxID=7868 RepID=V9KC11_CALMI
MARQSDDCYFYFYSTCTKGDSCVFRHCEAALGSETVCNLWQEGRCFRQVCKFRHMEIDKRRSEIPCYWEKQLSGCTKLNCAFRHCKPRFIEGIFFPPTKGIQSKPEVTELGEEAKMPQSTVNQLQQPKLPIQSNPSPQVRGVMKMEASENVPSPTHPPVVINAADDDEDDDDQFSEEGEENKNIQVSTADEQNGIRVISTKKQAIAIQQDENLDFGIKTLEQIKRKKAMKEKLKKIDEPSAELIQKVEENCENFVIEKENVRAVFRTVTLSPKKGDGEPLFKHNLAERLGKKKLSPKSSAEEVPQKATIAENEILLKRNLSDRLGKRKVKMDEEPDELPHKIQTPRPMKERLGLPMEVVNTDRDKPGNKADVAGEIRVKTLEEIRREKAAKKELVNDDNEDPKTDDAIVVNKKKPDQVFGVLEEAAKIVRTIRVKTFSEALLEKKQAQLLEEKEKGKGKGCSPTKQPEDEPAKEGNSGTVKARSRKASPEQTAVPPKPFEKVRVKTLEEIRREKALRRPPNQEASAPQQQDDKPKTEAAPTRRRIMRLPKPTETVKPEKAETQSVESIIDTAAEGDAKEIKAASGKETPVLQKVQVKRLEEILKEKRLRKQQETEKLLNKTQVGEEAPVVSTAEEANGTSQTEVEKKTQEAAPMDTRPNNRLTVERPAEKAQEKLVIAKPVKAEPAPAPKVKPKLNVKPSVVKSPVRLSQKRKSPDGNPSAIVAVKPLNAVTPDVGGQLSPKRAVLALPSRSKRETVSSPIVEVPETSMESVHLVEQSKPPPCVSLPEMANFSPPRPAVKARRASSTASKTVEDDFEELMKEFSDDKLEAEIDLDPGKDEDDLLLELSEMIDS